jgi:tetratricopeptide (TPR) repeat protein
MIGEFEEARTLYRQEQEYLETLGPSRELASTSLDSGRVELLAGDLEAAERELRRDDAALELLGERYFRSTIAGMLAIVLWRRGNVVDADLVCTLAEELSEPDDVGSQVYWRLTRSLLIAASDPHAARSLANEAVGMADGTAGLSLWADALRSRAELLGILGEREAAESSRDEAVSLYERKGDVVSAATTRGLITRVVADVG